MTRDDLLKARALYLELRDLLAEHGMLGRSEGETEAAENNARRVMTNAEAHAYMLEKHGLDLRPTDEERQCRRESYRTGDVRPFIRDRYGMDVIDIEAATDDEWEEWITALRVAMTAELLLDNPSIKLKDAWWHIGGWRSGPSLNKFRSEIWPAAHARNGKPLGKSNRGRKIGWRKKIK